MSTEIRKPKTVTVPDGKLKLQIFPLFSKPYKSRGNRLLRIIQRIILEEPKRMNMRVPCVLDVDKKSRNFTARMTASDIREYPPCKTVGCVAGWADNLTLGGAPVSAKARQWARVQARAIRVLGLTKKEANNLFHVHNWPDEFERRYRRAENMGDYEERAKVTAERIDFFFKKRY